MACPMRTRGACRSIRSLAVVRQTRQPEPARGRDQCALLRFIGLAETAKIEIEAGVGRRHQKIERLAGRAQDRRYATRDRQRPVHRGRQNRTDFEIDDAMGPRLHEADARRRSAFVEPRVEGCPASPRAMGIDQRLDRDIEPGPCQCRHQEPAFPARVFGDRQRLDRATAASPVIGADGRHAVSAFRQDLEDVSAFAIALGQHRFARQGIGHVDGLALAESHALAAPAEPLDGQPELVRSHGARRGGTRGCRRRLRSGMA